MANPQQPEVRRSERNPALSPDAMRAKLEARRDEIDNQIGEMAQPLDPVTPVPQHEQADQPDLDDFAEALGIEANDS